MLIQNMIIHWFSNAKDSKSLMMSTSALHTQLPGKNEDAMLQTWSWSYVINIIIVTVHVRRHRDCSQTKHYDTKVHKFLEQTHSVY